jgi:conjugative relaxase-like TrwC/TraI family protein
MLTISKPLSASQARTYHEREFASQKQNYWSRDHQGHSEWQGKLAEQWKLTGRVEPEHFARLSEGQHPHTAAQLVRHQVSRTYEGKFGKEVTSAEHRAGWDATFSAPKSVSLTALVGGDERVREAHRESVRVCGSRNQSEFPTEMIVHFPGVRNLDKPTVLVFPEVLVCFDCGFSRFTTPETELKRLAEGSGHTQKLYGKR